jgi:hypothetical protein
MSLFQSISDWVYREYDRRVKRASLITEYGAVHHDDAHEDHTHPVVQQPQAVLAETQSDDDDSESVIINVPRGTVVAVDDDEDAVEIVNVPRGTVVPRNDDTSV